jgi:hypothetical protein
MPLALLCTKYYSGKLLKFTKIALIPQFLNRSLPFPEGTDLVGKFEKGQLDKEYSGEGEGRKPNPMY